MAIEPSRAIEFYKTLNQNYCDFLYYAIHVPTKSLMPVSMARFTSPYGVKMFEYLENSNIPLNLKRTLTIMRLNMVKILMKGTLANINATMLEEAFYTSSNGNMINYKQKLFDTLNEELSKFRRAHGEHIHFKIILI